MNLTRLPLLRRAREAAFLLVALIAAGAFPALAAAAEDPGSIVIVQSTIPEGPQDFSYTSELPEYGIFALDDDDDPSLSNQLVVTGLEPGAYPLYQDEPAIGFVLLDATCADPDGGTNGYTNGALIDLDAGETITCTFTNSRSTGDVVIRQDTVPNDAVAFGFDAGGLGSFTLNDDGGDADLLWPEITYEGVLPGSFAITQDAVAGWDLTGLTCTDPDEGTTVELGARRIVIDVDPGEVIDCTFTNGPTPGEPEPPAPPATPSCNGKAATIVGAPGDSATRGTQGDDVIVDLDGKNRIDGRGGNDTICTGSADDIVNGGGGADWIDAGAGANTVDGGAGNDTIRAAAGADVLLGGTGNDAVDGGDGNNLVSTGAGNDAIVTGAGDDRIDGGKNVDTCQAGGGVNSVNHCEG